jgi:hypothetical protein
MQIEVVRHHSRAQDADGEIKHLAISQQICGGDQADGGFAPQWLRNKDFVRKTRGNGGNQPNDHSLHPAEAPALQRQHEKNVEAGQQHASQ